MRDFDVEMAVGDSLQIGNHILTIIDIQPDEISVRLDPLEDSDGEQLPSDGPLSGGRLMPR